MKQTIGVGVLLAVAVAAARYGGAPPQGAPAGGAQVAASALRSPKHPPAVHASYAGGCSAFEGKAAGKDVAQDPNHGAARAVLDKFLAIDPSLPVGTEARTQRFAGVQFAVATAPDPRHTNLALGFDREMVLLQEAAQDDGFTYNSSWLPWTGEAATFPLLRDQQRDDDRRDEREACPGILLFRKGVQPSQTGSVAADPYANGLIVFVVGEQPTGGVNEEQWANTMHWLATNVPVPSAPVKASLNILGPTFSGSLPSVERDLAKLYADPSGSGSDAAALRERFAAVRLLSGGVSSCSSIRWFQRQIEQPRFRNRVLFGSFAENDDVQIYRFLQFERAQGTELDEVAILSEDETAYADLSVLQATDDKPGQCAVAKTAARRPVRLSYPRDISAVRAAYDKQAIFNARTASAARPILKEDPDLEGPNDQATDTIRAYSGSLSAIAQEAVLYGIVTTLRTHHTRFLLLRCSNPLDFLFLTRFFHQAYPEARIVTVTSDQLFRREIDTTEFRGVLALANYPLLSRNQHWSRLSEVAGPPPLHTHRVFDANDEGNYIAARYVFDPMQRGAEPDRNGHLALPLLENLPDYADPFWMTRPCSPPAQTNAPVWLSVLGRDGYWPVAVLNERTTPEPQPPVHPPPSTIVRLRTSPGVHYDLAPAAAPNAQPRFNKSLLFAFPFAWTLCVVLACGLLLFQLFAIASDSGLTSSGLFAPFRQMPRFSSQAILLGLNTTFATMPALLLFSVALVAPPLEYVDRVGRNFWFWLAVCGFTIVGLLFTLLLHREMRRVPVPRTEASRRERVLRLRPDRGLAAGVYVGSLLVLSTLAVSVIRSSCNPANDAALFLRMVHLTSGVSPLAPPLLILLGFYLWTWQALAGNVLLADGRPRLPAYSDGAERPRRNLPSRLFAWLRFRPVEPSHAPGCSLGRADYRISEGMGGRIFDVAGPLSLDLRVVVIPLLIAVVALGPFMPKALPLLSIEGARYAISINMALLLAFLLTTAEALRLYSTWMELRRLLVALDRLRLRRTFARLRAIPQGSLWSVSGSVQRTQMQFFSQQMDAARRLRALIGNASPRLDDAVACGDLFAVRSAPRVSAGPLWEKPLRTSWQQEAHLRVALADATADILNRLLSPAWAREQESLHLVCEGSLQTGEGDGHASLNLTLSAEPAVRVAEEFVCLQYIAFIQNVLARMRTMVLSMGLLFVATCLAISFYPFVPRTQIGLWMGADLALVAASVIVVYAGLERDNTLSYMTNTVPGRLGGEFYVKTATFLIGPVFGLLTTQFPAISEFVLGVLQPGLDAIK